MSIYKRFRSVQQPNEVGIAELGNSGAYSMSPRFDQPTYLSFKLIFGEGGDAFYNNAANENFVLNYDRMPHPLFASKGNDNVYDRERYSAIDYLLDANEFTRAKMLTEFINLFNRLQYDYQWYFQKIDGISDLLKIEPTKGQRITSDKRLKVTALEGVDLRLTHLMNMYRKIAWDDTYQRWVLPDMMRYFTLQIYITEFRTFHTPSPYTGFGYAVTDDRESQNDLKLNILDDILPVWQITCEMCEFDVESVDYNYLSSLGVDSEPEQAGVTFDIKVGKMYETQIYPTFKNAYLVDRYLNGLDRSKNEEILVPGDGDIPPITETFDSTSPNANNNSTVNNNKTKLAVGQNQTYNDADREHISGASYNEQTNKKRPSGEDVMTQLYDLAPESLATQNEREEGSRNSWFGNAAEQGKAFLENRAEEVFDKAKITPIPGLGISFSEVQVALQGKNIITALGLIRKGVNNVVNDFAQPSELLEGEIYADEVFMNYLETIAKSEATNESEVSLIEAANIALSDNTILSAVRDFSRATDLEGKGETSEPISLETTNGILQTSTNSEATNDPTVSLANVNPPGESTINDNINNELNQGDVLSEATNNSNAGEALDQESTSSLNNKISDELSNGEAGSEATSGNVEGGGLTQGAASEAIKNKAEGGSLPQGAVSRATSGSVSSEDLEGAESNINKKIPVGTIFEGVPTSQATTNKLQS